MRPVTFNKQKALADVTQLFWKQGYEGTSVQEILDCMRLSRSSLYTSFGDKRALFVQALEQFSRMSQVACSPLATMDEPREAVRRFYELVFFALPEDQRAKGCLLVNTVLEQSGLDDELAALASARLRDIEMAFERCFERASLAGGLKPDQDPAGLAAFFMTMTRGLRVMARERRSEEELRAMIATALDILN